MALHIAKISATDLAKKFGTPLYVYDKNIILEKIELMKKSFPNARICYAIKANSNIHILQLIANQGLGADCSSEIELELAKRAGFDMSKSIFTSVNPTDQDLKKALELGVIVNLDHLSIFHRLQKMGLPKTISFRLNPGIGAGKFPEIVCGGKGTKFGMLEQEAIEAYRLAKDAGIKSFGIHMMTGSCVLKEDYFLSITDAILQAAKRIAQELEINFEFIDIGGGFGVPYEDHERPLDIESLGRKISSKFNETITLMLEPGRFFVAESATLLTQVTTIKPGFIGVDAGMTTLIRPALYGAYHKIVLASDPLAPPTQKVNIVGPICESTDFFAKDRPMPQIKLNDMLAIKTVGAYGYAMASQFNGRLKPAEVLVDNQTTKIIREREKIEAIL